MFSPSKKNPSPNKSPPKYARGLSFLNKFWRRKSRSSSAESRLLQPTQISDVHQVETETCEVECKSPLPIRQHVLITTHETDSPTEHVISIQPRPVLVAPPTFDDHQGLRGKNTPRTKHIKHYSKWILTRHITEETKVHIGQGIV